MKNAQAKIDALLDVLVERLHDEMIAQPGCIPTPAQFDAIERLVKLSNQNNQRQEKVAKPPEAGKTASMSAADLVRELKASRAPDLFPRRGPRNGKRENVAPPVPPPTGDPRPLCAIHDAFCDEKQPNGTWVCSKCRAETPETAASLLAKSGDGMVNLKTLR